VPGRFKNAPDFRTVGPGAGPKGAAWGEIAVDFYPIRGRWTKIHAKYLLRPLTHRLPPVRLLRLIDRNADLLMRLSNGLNHVGLGMLRRFVPIVDFKGTIPADLTRQQLREWVVPDTFDMFSPRFDNPQRIAAVVRISECAGAEVHFTGYVDCGTSQAAVVRAVRI